MKFIFFFLTIFLSSLLMLLASCKKDLIIFATGKVIDMETKLPIEDARVILNAVQTVSTDSNGEFDIKYNLKQFLADSIVFNVSKVPLYHDTTYSTIIGNTQQDIFIIPLRRR